MLNTNRSEDTPDGVIMNETMTEEGVTLFDNGGAWGFRVGAVSYMIDKAPFEDLSPEDRKSVLLNIKKLQETHEITPGKTSEIKKETFRKINELLG